MLVSLRYNNYENENVGYPLKTNQGPVSVLNCQQAIEEFNDLWPNGFKSPDPADQNRYIVSNCAVNNEINKIILTLNKKSMPIKYGVSLRYNDYSNELVNYTLRSNQGPVSVFNCQQATEEFNELWPSGFKSPDRADPNRYIFSNCALDTQNNKIVLTLNKKLGKSIVYLRYNNYENEIVSYPLKTNQGPVSVLNCQQAIEEFNDLWPRGFKSPDPADQNRYTVSNCALDSQNNRIILTLNKKVMGGKSRKYKTRRNKKNRKHRKSRRH